ncbi:MAG TPA: carboxymuconolactone decarboxylase family protein [Polyangiaceae bacterium]|nr:carboxymuconolactone decarboxylase family protein [Polyangiaceae bacterium]
MQSLETTQPSPNPVPSSKYFPTHELETAPAEARPFLEEQQRRFGFVPLASARHATAPAVVEGFGLLHGIFEKTSLSPLEREAVALVLAGKLDCTLCREIHRRMARHQGASAELVEALLARRDITDPRLRALAELTERVVDTRGELSDAELEHFVDAGFTPRQALEVVVGIATYTLSIFANRMTRSETVR